jgi:prepilin-type N-terminal cleavage/methylation domain-containing protein/prepilin-type processing-associated H-X9-DG protein
MVRYLNGMLAKNRKAFSLVELLVVIAIISLLMSILMPVLVGARAQGRQLVCRSNIRQLILANIGYSNENDGFCVPAASDMWLSAGPLRGGLHRWHGVRDSGYEPFDPLRGPLVAYLADGEVKECPEKVGFVKDSNISFEQGCGGYGYNMTYLGSRQWRSGIQTMSEWKKAYAETTKMVEVRRPAMTLMFADCAMSLEEGSYIEYSFAEPPYFVINGQLFTGMYSSPSIHFRHRGRANIGWADGHIEPRPMARRNEKNYRNVDSARMKLGWFEPIDNSLFDLK